MICTGGHPFYVKEFDKFIRAEELKIGFTLLLSDGTPVRIEAIEKECLSVPETTYNFEVADFHTYYVSDSKVLVHNDCKGASKKQKFEDWLNEGEANYVVYKGIDSKSKEVYTGITKQKTSRRLWQHNYKSKKQNKGERFKQLSIKHSNLTRNQARAIETYYIVNEITSNTNLISSISKDFEFYEWAMEWAAQHI